MEEAEQGKGTLACRRDESAAVSRRLAGDVPARELRRQSESCGPPLEPSRAPAGASPGHGHVAVQLPSPSRALAPVGIAIAPLNLVRLHLPEA